MSENDKPEVKTISFTLRESGAFRVVHVDGAFGGLTPTGKLYAAIYSQLPPIPSRVVQKVLDTGALGEEVSREMRRDVDRVLEVGLVMDMNTATSLRDWLSIKIKQLEEQLKKED